MAASSIISNLLRLTSWDSGKVFVIVVGETGESTLLLDNACAMMLLMQVFCVCDGDFMVIGAVIEQSGESVSAKLCG